MSSKTHTAIVATDKGKIGSLDVPTRSPGKGEVRVKVSHSSLIAFDTYITDFAYAIESYPVVLGFNASGVVVEVGEGVSDLKTGDRVC
jgi:NADPH:quinone reductase-like Zn-dependent oxidoreductase